MDKKTHSISPCPLPRPGTFAHNISLSLYIHIPWCLKKCPYCDFNSYAMNPSSFEDQYIDCLIKDFERDRDYIHNRKLQAIFIGGGTPSLFSSKSFDKLLNAISKRISFDGEIEITLEANPGTVHHEKLVDFYFLGINRLSLGVQSFQDKALKELGRIHSATDAKEAIKMAQKAGFYNINLDIMHGLPGQSVREALRDLKEAFSFSPTHLSWYQLTLEPEASFSKQKIILPDEGILFEIQEEGHDFLIDRDYIQYEISAYSQLNKKCRHNIHYWEFGDYIGIGAGAHSKITEGNKIIRYQKIKHPNNYLKNENACFIEQREILSKEQLPLEFMMNALRLIDGVPMDLFNERTRLPVHSILPFLQQAVKEGLLIDSTQHLKTTLLGQRFLNECLEIFIPNTFLFLHE